jgi:hypothetical protein
VSGERSQFHPWYYLNATFSKRDRYFCAGLKVRRVLRLTLLAPDVVDEILGGQQPRAISLAALMPRFRYFGWRSGESFPSRKAINPSPSIALRSQQ